MLFIYHEGTESKKEITIMSVNDNLYKHAHTNSTGKTIYRKYVGDLNVDTVELYLSGYAKNWGNWSFLLKWAKLAV
jgi:hypothetical protein